MVVYGRKNYVCLPYNKATIGQFTIIATGQTGPSFHQTFHHTTAPTTHTNNAVTIVMWVSINSMVHITCKSKTYLTAS